MAIDLGMASPLALPRHLLSAMHFGPTFHVRLLPTCAPAHLQLASPESPRWLAYAGHFESAQIAVAQTNTNGNTLDPVSVAIYREIVDTLRWEKEEGHTLSPREIIRDKMSLRRVLIGASAGPFSCIAGNIIASYYLGAELDTAGITGKNQQLKAVSPLSSSLPWGLH